MRSRLYLIIISFAVFSSPGESSADIFKCPGKDGKTLYQTEPCLNDEGEKVLKSEEYVPRSSSQNRSNLLNAIEDSENDLIQFGIVDNGFNVSESEVAFLRSSVKFLYYFYQRFFGFDGKMKIKMSIFGNQKDYYDSFSKFGSAPVASGGVYFPNANEGLINGGGRSRRGAFISTVHETTHAILQKKVKYVPNWINEGMAEYFETLSVKKGTISIPPQNRRYNQLAEFSKSGGSVSLQRYFSQNSGPFARSGQVHNQANRTIAWSVVHFLMSSESGQKSLFRIIKDLRQSGGRNSVEIIDKNYTGGIEGLERKWLKYLRTPSATHYYDKEGLKLFR